MQMIQEWQEGKAEDDNYGSFTERDMDIQINSEYINYWFANRNIKRKDLIHTPTLGMQMDAAIQYKL